MASVLQKIKIWLTTIQNSDEKTKRRYLIIASAITMILIISLWLIYLKSTIQGVNQETASQTSNTQFWQIFKSGLNITGQSIKENIQNIISQIFQGKTITIK